jgi:hypothetical protein
MILFRSVRFTIVAAVLGAAALVTAQTGTQQQAPPMPKPGPEHAILKMDEGTWDAVVEFFPAPGAPPMTSKGVEVNTIGCMGLCLISDFKAEGAGGSFQGRGVVTWDPAKKKYVGSWTDSMSTGLAITEGTYDPATKKWSGWMEGPDMTGKVMKTRSVSEWTAAGGRVMTAYATGPDGKEMQVMKIIYTRRK